MISFIDFLSNSINESVKYTAPSSPQEKFLSDLAREFDALHFPFYNNRKDSKSYKTLPVMAHANENKLPRFTINDIGELFLQRLSGNNFGLIISADDNKDFYKGTTWTLLSLPERTEIKTGISRKDLAEEIVNVMADKYNFKNYSNIWDEFYAELEKMNAQDKEFVSKRTKWLNGDFSDSPDSASLANDSYWVNKWTKDKKSREKDIKLYKQYLEGPQLPSIK